MLNAVTIFYSGDPKLKYHYNLTPLHIAAGSGKKTLLENLFKTAKDEIPRDNWGKTPLHLAAKNGHLEVCKQIIQKVYKENPKGIYNRLPLIMSYLLDIDLAL